MNIPWTTITGREIDSTPLESTAKPQRVVACMNVWNDVEALKQTMPIWIRFVDHIIVVDGSYNTIGKALSTDGTREFVKGFGAKVTLVDGHGLTQCQKRSMFFTHTREGDYLFVVDADERVFDPQRLRQIPRCDVAWVQMKSSIYQRLYGQPRIFRWQPALQYRGRHHWVYQGEHLLCTHQYSGPGFAHAPINILIENQRHLGRSKVRMHARHTNLSQQSKLENSQIAMPTSKMSDSSLHAREALYIVQHAYRDDGIAPSRFHTAINRTTPHWSMFFKSRPGPFGVGGQYDTRGHSVLLAHALQDCDVAHYHVMMSMAGKQVPTGKPTVFHHHGTMFRRNAVSYMAEAKKLNALVLVSNLELLSYVDGGSIDHFMPNVVPVARYRALRALHNQPYTGGVFRIGHSPSQPVRKGTEAFLAVCQKLNRQGIRVEPVVLTAVSHREALLRKASCHAFFDSFWLGMQCSGLEAAAMQMPVIAGDPEVAARYTKFFGAVPYTFANDEEQLSVAIHTLVTDEAYRAQEAQRVAEYVLRNHDEAPVALRYLDALDTAFKWRTTLRAVGKAKMTPIVPGKYQPARVRR